MRGSACDAGIVGDDSKFAGGGADGREPWALYRDRLERAQAVARSRYRDHLTAALARHHVADPAALADVALDALTRRRYSDSGAQCRCSCHPRLPDSDLHDYGFDCPCTHSAEHRRRVLQTWRADVQAFWESEEGTQIAAAERAADNELGAWLATQHGVQMRRLCDVAPEHWSGNVDGHRFDFRERHGQWDIEIEERPGEQSLQGTGNTVAGATTSDAEHGFSTGDVIACGTIADAGYGTMPVERARFIVDTIRIHLTRRTCSHHLDRLASLESLLGTSIYWCPNCGRRLSPQHHGSDFERQPDTDENH